MKLHTDVTKHFEKIHTLKLLSKSVKFGTKSTHLEKQSCTLFQSAYFFQSAMPHIEKIKKCSCVLENASHCFHNDLVFDRKLSTKKKKPFVTHSSVVENA